ncbi:MAG: hypothetical protein LBJ89_02830, partial [Holosporales bacterium]|nr:hypothetical protein [Holosporales bacterium]
MKFLYGVCCVGLAWMSANGSDDIVERQDASPVQPDLYEVPVARGLPDGEDIGPSGQNAVDAPPHTPMGSDQQGEQLDRLCEAIERGPVTVFSQP